MKYYKTSRFPKAIGATGLFTIIIGCLLVLGIASWFAVSRYNASKTAPKVTPDVSSYTSSDSSYNSTVESNVTTPPPVTSEVNDTVSDVPYESEQEESIAEKPIARSFVMPIEGNISKGYSDSALQYSATYGDMRLHKAIDIVGKKGCEVKAVGMGTVTEIGESGTLGKYVVIDHGDGIEIKYCGFDGIIIAEGDSVSAGTVIGTLGTIPSECSDQSHLHIEASVGGEIGAPLDILKLN